LSRLSTDAAGAAEDFSASEDSESDSQPDKSHPLWKRHALIVDQKRNRTSSTAAVKVNAFKIDAKGQLEDVTSNSDLPICSTDSDSE
jgi:hypothetical protein